MFALYTAVCPLNHFLHCLQIQTCVLWAFACPLSLLREMKRASQTTGQALSSSQVLTHQVLLLLYWSFPDLLMRDRSKMCNRDDALIHCLLRVMERNYLNNRTGSLIWYKHCLEYGKRNTWYYNEYKRKSLNEGRCAPNIEVCQVKTKERWRKCW